MDLTVLIITKNAGKTLARTLESVRGLGATCIVVDDYSTDDTVQIARSSGATVTGHHSYDLGRQRAYALGLVKTEWTLVLDSDEALPPELVEEIRSTLQNSSCDGYYITFRNHLFGKKIAVKEYHHKLVLFRTSHARIEPAYLHEAFTVTGSLGRLQSEALHYSYRSPGQIIRKFAGYSVRQAKQHKEKKTPYGLRQLILNPLHLFIARFITDGGYREGLPRLFLDLAFAAMEFGNYALIPFVQTGVTVGADCGGYTPEAPVRSGIERIVSEYQKRTTLRHWWFGFSEQAVHRLPRTGYAQLWLPLAILLRRCNAFIGFSGQIPLLLSWFPIRKIVCIYDLGFMDAPDLYPGTAQTLARQTKAAIERADCVVVLNPIMKRQLEERFNTKGKQIEVIPAGADHLLDTPVQECSVPAGGYDLHVGVFKRAKNMKELLGYYVKKRLNLVCVGEREEEYAGSIETGSDARIVFMNGVSDGQLVYLYTHARRFVSTSVSEGFCFPVLEALCAGVPVIARDLPLFRLYAEQFPHLSLARSEAEMENLIESVPEDRTTVERAALPFRWEAFCARIEEVLL